MNGQQSGLIQAEWKIKREAREKKQQNKKA